MTDSPPNNLQSRQGISREAFARFLEALSPDSEEAGLRYARLHEKLIGFFILKGISDPESAADETLDRAVVKLNDETPVTDLNHYCMGIGRNVARERLRRTRREERVFLEFIERLADGTEEQVERIYLLFKPCFAQLEIKDQELLQAYCRVMKGRSRGEFRQQLAEQMNTGLLALRMRVSRLRAVLKKCVKKRLKES